MIKTRANQSGMNIWLNARVTLTHAGRGREELWEESRKSQDIRGNGVANWRTNGVNDQTGGRKGTKTLYQKKGTERIEEGADGHSTDSFLRAEEMAPLKYREKHQDSPGDDDGQRKGRRFRERRRLQSDEMSAYGEILTGPSRVRYGQ